MKPRGTSRESLGRTCQLYRRHAARHCRFRAVDYGAGRQVQAQPEPRPRRPDRGARGLSRDGHEDVSRLMDTDLMRSWFWYAALLAAGCGYLSDLPLLPGGSAFLDALGIFLADLSGHRADPGLVFSGTETPAERSASAAVAAALFRAGGGQLLDRAADPHRLLRPAHVLRASLGAFRAASFRRLLHRAGHERAGAVRRHAQLSQAAGDSRARFRRRSRSCSIR